MSWARFSCIGPEHATGRPAHMLLCSSKLGLDEDGEAAKSRDDDKGHEGRVEDGPRREHAAVLAVA
jgi:hypothetical protein